MNFFFFFSFSFFFFPFSSFVHKCKALAQLRHIRVAAKIDVKDHESFSVLLDVRAIYFKGKNVFFLPENA